MRPELSAAVRAASREVTPELVAEMWQVFAPGHTCRGPSPACVVRDLSYGPDHRQQLDLHIPSEGTDGPAPVLVFIPGGGFVAGNRHTPGTPYYDHVGRWAVEHGMLGVTVDYRLAPAHTWPTGAADVAAAVARAQATVAEHGGDPARIVLAGHSAGAAHVAGFLAGHGGPAPPGIVGAALLSGLYDLDDTADDPLMRLYFGADPATHAERSALPELLDSPVPLLLAFAELDPPLFHAHLARFVAAYHARHGRIPPLTCAVGHNHISEIVSLRLDDDPLGVALATFVAALSGTGDSVPAAGRAL